MATDNQAKANNDVETIAEDDWGAAMTASTTSSPSMVLTRLAAGPGAASAAISGVLSSNAAAPA